MNARTIAYWVVTGLFAALMLFNAAAYLTNEPHAVEGFQSLGYPAYFRILLGVAKVLGAVVLLAPGLKVVKEWAYAGFGITFVSAFVSHLACGQGIKAIAPVVVLAVLAASYFLRPANRRLAETPAA